MATTTLAGRGITSRTHEGLVGGLGFDRLMAFLGVVFISGAYLDGWAHSHGFVDDTFFTPWHGVLYGGFALNVFAVMVATLINRRGGQGWLTAIPRGYELALLGAPIFFLGGVSDLVWHTLFGFETGIDPLLSPAHLSLATGAFLIMSGPLRATWRRARQNEQNWGTLLAAVLSLTTVFSLLTFFSTYMHPFMLINQIITPYDEWKGSWGSASILVQAGILMSFLLFALRRWHLPIGSITLIITLNAALVSVFEDTYLLIPGALLTGLIGDILLWQLRPSLERLGRLRVFAAVLPIISTFSFFVSIMVFYENIAWSIHLWLGVTLISGVVGLLLSYLLHPPTVPEE